MTRAGNVCLISAGAQVTLATSSDERHPAENIVDGNPDTFWTSTGMFPQEFVISLSGIQKINKIILQSSQIRSLRIETSTSKEPMHFESCVERDPPVLHLSKRMSLPAVDSGEFRDLTDKDAGTMGLSSVPIGGILFNPMVPESLNGLREGFIDLDYVEGQLQNEEFPIPGVQTAQLRFVILSGYDHFVSVHSVSAEGGV